MGSNVRIRGYNAWKLDKSKLQALKASIINYSIFSLLESRFLAVFFSVLVVFALKRSLTRTKATEEKP